MRILILSYLKKLDNNKLDNMISFYLNGDESSIEDNTSISDLLNKLSLDKTKIAIEKDLIILDENDYKNIFIENGSKIEIVSFIGGG